MRQKSGGRRGGAAGWWLRFAARTVLLLFMLFDAGAIYYSTIQPQAVLILLTIGYALFAGYALLFMKFRAGMLAGALISAVVFVWYVNDPPLNDRDWAVEYATPATVSVNDGVVTIQNIRNFSYRSETDMIPDYYNASFRLDQLSSVDLVAGYWSGRAIAHLFLTFNFQDGQHLAISIETRRQKRFSYSVVAGFFHHYELFYVVADERDVIGGRTDVRHEQVYLYRLYLTPQRRQALFMSYMNKVQDLAVHPQWYNTLTDNCTTGILARAKDPEPARLNWHLVLSGYVPGYAYKVGLLNRDVSFPVLEQDSLIVRPAGAVIGTHYSRDIRASLPLYPHS